MLHCVLPLLTGLLLLPLPDIIPEGMRGIRVDSRIDAKALAAEHCLGYVLQKGDTLIALARTHLGDEARWPEIEKLNPLLEADKLRPGERIWLPPRDVAAAKKEPVFAYSGTGHLWIQTVSPLVDAGTIQPTHYGNVTLLLVPESARPALRAALTATETPRTTPETALKALVDTGKLTQIAGHSPGRFVATNDPTASRLDTYVVEKGADGKFGLRVNSVAYDKDGKQIASNGTTGDKKQQALFLLLLTSGGGLLLLRRRARAAGQPQPAIA